MNQIWRKIMLIVFIILIIIVILILGINFFVVLSTQRNIITEEDAKELENVDCIFFIMCWNNCHKTMIFIH